MRKAKNIIHTITMILSIISYVGFFGIMLLSTCDVIIRYATGNSILGVYEIVEQVMVCAVFASFAYTQSEHGHVSINMLIGKFPKKLQYVLYFIHSLLSIAISIMLIYASYRQGNVALTSHYTTGVLYIPLWPFYWVQIVSIAALALVFAYEAVEYIAAVFSPKVAAIAQESIGGETGL